MPAARALPALRTPLQARSQDSLERMLEAAEALIAEQGFARATMAEIARRARSSVGAVYARFRDKDALLTCLHERFCARAVRSLESALAPERWEGVAAADAVRAVVAVLLRLDRDQGALVRAFVLQTGHDPAYAARAAEVGRVLSRRLRALLLARRDELGGADPETAIDFGVWLVLAHLDQRALYGDVETTERTPSARARRAELERVLLASLGSRDAPRPGRRGRTEPRRR